jgi:hypothetical protein
MSDEIRIYTMRSELERLSAFDGAPLLPQMDRPAIAQDEEIDLFEFQANQIEDFVKRNSGDCFRIPQTEDGAEKLIIVGM